MLETKLTRATKKAVEVLNPLSLGFIIDAAQAIDRR